MVDRGLSIGFLLIFILMDFIENVGFGASPVRTSVWCSPAGDFFFRSTTCLNRTLFWIFQLMLLKKRVLVHPQFGLLCGAALPFFFLLRKTGPWCFAT